MRILISIPDDLHEKIKDKSKEKGLTVTSLIRMILIEYVAIPKKPDKP